MIRLVVFATVSVFSCSALVALQEPRAADSTATFEAIIHEARQAQQLPGLAVVITRTDGQPTVYASGERRIGKGDPITPADRMHLGSLTKAITATVIGALVERGRMTPETTISQVFPELSPTMQPAYRNVTVRQLLGHAAGIPQYRTRESLQPLLTLEGTATEQRLAFLERVLAVAPRFEPGTRHEYSNAGGAVAGAMAERIGGAPYRHAYATLQPSRDVAVAAFTNLGGDQDLRNAAKHQHLSLTSLSLHVSSVRARTGECPSVRKRAAGLRLAARHGGST